MPSLRDKLDIYKKKTPLSEPTRPTPERFGAEKLCEGDVPLWRFVSMHNLEEHASRLSVPLRKSITPFSSRLGIDGELRFEDLVFVDLETTSLSIGAGSYAFLFGLGTVQGRTLVVEQYFMHEYSEEPAILRKMLKTFQEKTAVTYNGHSFDIPLLKNRYRINRVPGFPVEKKSIDLLHPSRAVFKSLFENCALSTLETRVLGIARTDDIPSWLIPEVYFSYQKTGETQRMGSVIAHHRQDIASMALLLLFFVNVYENLEKRRFHAISGISISHVARWLYRRDCELFLDVVQFLGEDVFKDRLLFKKFSCAMKRLGRRDEIMSFWKRDESVFSKEELAKHCEHIEKNYSAALKYCQEALALLDDGLIAYGEEISDVHMLSFHRERFITRMQRLSRKIEDNATIC